MSRRLDLIALVLVVTGIVAALGGGIGALRESDPVFALPYVASGVVGGFALAVFGVALLWLQRTRRAALQAHHAHVERLIAEAAS